MKIWKYLFLFLGLATLTIWSAVFLSPDGKFHLIACDVGEGDAILITYKNIQILTDGGPNNKVVDCLAKHLPFWDRKIEAVILTHPDTDHYRGLIEVSKRYQIEKFIYNGQEVSTSDFQVLKKGVGGLQKTFSGAKIRAGMIRLDILSPKEMVKDGQTNDNSVVTLVNFGNFKALLTGDAPFSVLDNLETVETVNYIKISHHGSKTGTDEDTIQKFLPKIAVISVGRNNYGHPDAGVLELIEKINITVLRTDELGSVEIITNGQAIWLKK